MKYTKLTSMLCAAFAIVSCSEKKDSDADNSPASESTLESMIVKVEPAGAKSITEVRKAVEVGKEITIAGKIMGRDDPFVEGRAMLMIGDPAIITSCDLRPGDSCVSPWDVCCDEPEDIKAAIATVQILDANGRVLKQGIKGVSGIKELSQLVITGTIAEGSNADNLLINATAIYVKP